MAFVNLRRRESEGFTPGLVKKRTDLDGFGPFVVLFKRFNQNGKI